MAAAKLPPLFLLFLFFDVTCTNGKVPTKATLAKLIYSSFSPSSFLSSLLFAFFRISDKIIRPLEGAEYLSQLLKHFFADSRSMQ